MGRILLTLYFVLSSFTFCEAKTLTVFFIDVEGGQATLVVSPSGESLLVDTGWPGFQGRDAERIVAAARQAGIKRIDYLLVTHYHMDHVGGVPQLAERISIGTFIDHGASVDSGKQADELMAAYDKVQSKGRHMLAQPGEKIPIAGLEVEVVAAAGRGITAPLEGAGQSNPLCTDTKPLDEDKSENAQSVGILLTYGKFRMIDLGDLTWNKELELACPANRLGQVDLYLSTHHGSSLSGPAAMVHALHPRVAVMNNGARKGGDAPAWQIIHSSPGLENIWQLHYAIEGGEKNNTSEPFIANLDERCKGYAVNLTAEADGSFSVTNTRNGFSKRYNAR
jgi:beta-lactamase superfamily II metal-dependent hydrolase